MPDQNKLQSIKDKKIYEKLKESMGLYYIRSGLESMGLYHIRSGLGFTAS